MPWLLRNSIVKFVDMDHDGTFRPAQPFIPPVHGLLNSCYRLGLSIFYEIKHGMPGVQTTDPMDEAILVVKLQELNSHYRLAGNCGLLCHVLGSQNDNHAWACPPPDLRMPLTAH
jgi:hypothetical protein